MECCNGATCWHVRTIVLCVLCHSNGLYGRAVAMNIWLLCTCRTYPVTPLQSLLAVGCYRGRSWVKSIFCPWYVPLPLHCLLWFKMFPGGCWWCLQIGFFLPSRELMADKLTCMQVELLWQTTERKHRVDCFILQCSHAPCCIVSSSSLHHVCCWAVGVQWVHQSFLTENSCWKTL